MLPNENVDFKDVELIDMAHNIIERIRLSVDTNAALGNIAKWVCDYTKLDADTDFSLVDHEMQEAIINDTCARTAVQKCSQVGLSEASARKALGITAISKNKNIMYVGPTRTWSSKFSTSRLKPIIDNSPMLSSMLSPNAKGSELLGIGTSFLHLGGTTGAATGAISVPASDIFIDEVDFCDPVVVGKYESRLKHAKEDQYGRKGRVNYFSTPTVPDYGINKHFKVSDQKHYQCQCSKCQQWFEPDYFEHIRIPDLDKPIADVTPEDINAGTYDIMGAYMECPVCKHDVWEDLCNPKRRKWVARYPEAIVSGYQIYPWDVPKVNSIPSILMQMTGYENIADYYNFTIGIPYTDHNNSFLMAPFENGRHSQWVEGKVEGDQRRFSMGVDVGKTSHIVIGFENRIGKLEVVYMETYKSSKDKLLSERIIELAKAFQTRSIVIDAAPDFSTAQAVAKRFPRRKVFACEYTKTKPKGKLTNTIFNDDENTVSAYRTGVLTDLLKRHNGNEIIYPNGSTNMIIKAMIDECKLNLKNLKKIQKKDPEGEEFESFIKTGPDHFGHALSYLNIAVKKNTRTVYTSPENIPAPTSVTTFNTNGPAANIAVPVKGIGLGFKRGR